MTKELVHDIEDAQATLHEEVTAALEKFTDTTGMCVPSMRWALDRALNCDGHTDAVRYWDIRSDLCTGIS